jgi:uncharacterized protein with beta-barrel porin domain
MHSRDLVGHRYSWNNAANWCGVIPSAASNVIIGPSANQPTIGAAGFCKNLTKTGATLTVSGSNTLTVNGNWTNNGNFISNAGTVKFSGTTAQVIGGSNATTFNHLTITNSTSDFSRSRNRSKNSLTIANSASVLDMGTHALTDGGTFLALVVVKLKQKTYPLLQFRLVKLGTVVLFIQT